MNTRQPEVLPLLREYSKGMRKMADDPDNVWFAGVALKKSPTPAQRMAHLLVRAPNLVAKYHRDFMATHCHHEQDEQPKE